MNSHLTTRILRTASVLLALNLILVGVGALFSSEDPITDLRLTSTQHRILIYGKSRLNVLSIKSFKNWAECERWLESQDKYLPLPDYASLGEAGVEIHSDRVLWGEKKFKNTLLAPDPHSANKLGLLIRHSQVIPSPLGFSILVN